MNWVVDEIDLRAAAFFERRDAPRIGQDDRRGSVARGRVGGGQFHGSVRMCAVSRLVNVGRADLHWSGICARHWLLATARGKHSLVLFACLLHRCSSRRRSWLLRRCSVRCSSSRAATRPPRRPRATAATRRACSRTRSSLPKLSLQDCRFSPGDSGLPSKRAPV